MLLMVEEGIRGKICHAIHSMQKQIISIWKIMLKTKNHHIFSVKMQSISLDRQLPVDGFKWEKKYVKI